MAVVEVGGKQFRISPEDKIKVEKIPADVGEEVVLDKVLMAEKEGEGLKVGNPFLNEVKVKARVVNQDRDRKIIVYKFKRRKNYHRKYGHRQPFTRLRIEEISWEGGE